MTVANPAFEPDPPTQLIRRFASPDLTPDEFRWELGTYRVADALPDERFTWTGDSRPAT
jgi:hypothetical protein